MTARQPAEFKPVVRTITQDRINLFHESFGGSNPIHTDAEAAKQTDFGAPVQHGIRTLFPVFADLARQFGDKLISGGKLSAKFIAPVIAGDVITSSIRPTETSDAGGEQRQSFEIEASKADGTKVIVGTASVRT